MKHLRFAGCLLATAAFTLYGCGSGEEAAYNNPPVGILESKGHQIVIHTGPEGPLYSVKGPDGKQLAVEISREELQASFPELNVSEIWAENSSAGTVPKVPIRVD